ncbi:MAG: hypothetical protein FWH57_11595, partial [Oscillospiraceae bacterium]|nr:hypothetical protein [Oscillospiraceae bacterium]
MKYFRKLFVCVIICAIILTMQTGCRKKSTDQSLGQTGAVGDITSENTGLGSIPEPINEAFKNVVIDHTFALSDGIDENGFWEGIRALDYVELFDYQDIQIDAQAVNVSEEEMEEEILLYLNNYPDQEIIMDREV